MKGVIIHELGNQKNSQLEGQPRIKEQKAFRDHREPLEGQYLPESRHDKPRFRFYTRRIFRDPFPVKLGGKHFPAGQGTVVLRNTSPRHYKEHWHRNTGKESGIRKTVQDTLSI